MPDKNKIAMMTDVEQIVIKTCYNCKHGAFGGGWNLRMWGICDNEENRYIHEKHNDLRSGPAHLFMVCSNWESRIERIRKSLGKYLNLLANNL